MWLRNTTNLSDNSMVISTSWRYAFNMITPLDIMQRQLKPTHNVTMKSTSILDYDTVLSGTRRSQWRQGLRCGTAATQLLEMWVRIPPGMSVCCECCVLSGRGLCDGLITRPEESYRVLCVWVWWWMLDNEEAVAHWSCCTTVEEESCLVCRYK